ncbi:GspH/FimT family protein [Leptothrix discophora]|uniref:Type II secretion system protein H n=1 Tax=Leptothrix discophora TaxID=89 RepID=A0ABT9G0Y0_LEPDI|nr:GspH/FimT family protein [Leptothrix discophora]MDP4300075.1 GspH/FimT family protein [Leptothrix discophora]
MSCHLPPLLPKLAAPVPAHGGASCRRGHTLIEALLVLAVIGLLLGALRPGWQEHLARRRVEAASAQLQADLDLLRAAAIAQNEGLRLTFRSSAAGSCYLLHSGEADRCACDADGQGVLMPRCEHGARLLQARTWRPTELTLQANISSLRVDPRQGSVSPSGSIELRGPGLPALRHVVNLLGRVRLCSVTGGDPSLPRWRGVVSC